MKENKLTWRERIAFGIMGLGLCVVVGIPIIDVGLALNGIMMPNVLMWGLCMIGVATMAFGTVFAVHGIGYRFL